MPTNPQNKPVTTSYTVILQDIDGQPLITVDSKEFSIILPDGTVSVQKNNTWLVLVDGTTWNPAMAARANDPIVPNVCRTCRRALRREKPTHGLHVNSAVCVECGETCCPRHRRNGTDGQPRCLACTRR
jgi:hypothetical protein